MDTAANDKSALRNVILLKRIKMSFEDVFRISSIIQKRFLRLNSYKTFKKLALYASFKNEVLTDSIMNHAIANGKNVYFPKVVNEYKGHRGLKFVEVKGKNDFEPGSYDIHEPVGKCDMPDIKKFDTVVVPGIAFDISGSRLGYGKGYYDKVLFGLKGYAILIGLAFDFQVVKTLSTESHDVSMDMIITERRIIRTGNNFRL